jgi:hypothetical protein
VIKTPLFAKVNICLKKTRFWTLLAIVQYGTQSGVVVDAHEQRVVVPNLSRPQRILMPFFLFNYRNIIGNICDAVAVNKFVNDQNKVVTVHDQRWKRLPGRVHYTNLNLNF